MVKDGNGRDQDEPILSFSFSQSYRTRNTGWAITLKDRILGLAATKRKTFKPKTPFSKDEASRRLYDDDHDDDACSQHARTHAQAFLWTVLFFLLISVLFDDDLSHL